jgi:hypothetical protein
MVRTPFSGNVIILTGASRGIGWMNFLAPAILDRFLTSIGNSYVE